MNVLLTGATGFIGRYTAMDLISRGYEVYGLVRASSSRRGTLPDKLHIVEADLQELREAELPSIDVCIHLAWAGAARDGRMNVQLQRDNIEDTLALIRAVAAKGCTRFIFSGSQAEYGITAADVNAADASQIDVAESSAPTTTEHTPCHPRSEYGRAKLEVLRRASQLCRELNMTYIHMRIFSVYGAGDQPNSLISLCAAAFAQKKVMAAASSCTQMWNFLHVRDCAHAIALLVSCPFVVDADAGEDEYVVNVAGARSRVLREYIEELAKAADPPGIVTFGGKVDSPEGTPYLNPDISKLVALTGFKEQVTWAAGMRDVLTTKFRHT